MSKRFPLSVYVVSVLVAWTTVLFAVSQLSPTNLVTTVALCAGFFLGMLYMYLRTRILHFDM